MSSYSRLEHFSHALEVLLHNIIEETQAKHNIPLIKAALELVKSFPQALKVMVNCARKSEMTLWKDFFYIAGDPKLFYQESMDAGDMSVATSYLIIIQTLDSDQISREVVFGDNVACC